MPMVSAFRPGNGEDTDVRPRTKSDGNLASALYFRQNRGERDAPDRFFSLFIIELPNKIPWHAFCKLALRRILLESLTMPHPHIARRQSGFTLIEIAIVLVIIGLLLGGILKGQELITQARIRNVANDFQSMTAAINLYQDRYRALPGMMRAQRHAGASLRRHQAREQLAMELLRAITTQPLLPMNPVSSGCIYVGLVWLEELSQMTPTRPMLRQA